MVRTIFRISSCYFLTMLSDWRPEANVPLKKNVRVFETPASSILMMRKRRLVYPVPSKPSYLSTELYNVSVIKLAQAVGAHVLKVTRSNPSRNINYIYGNPSRYSPVCPGKRRIEPQFVKLILSYNFNDSCHPNIVM